LMNRGFVLIIVVLFAGLLAAAGCSSVSKITPFANPEYSSSPASGASTNQTAQSHQITTAEQNYELVVMNESSLCINAYNAFANLFSNIKMDDSQWTSNANVQLGIIQSVYNQAMVLTPPASMSDIHVKYLQALKNMNDGTVLITKGLAGMDITLVTQGTQAMSTGSQLIVGTTQAINAFNDAHK
jgi:hypothetical protein